MNNLIILLRYLLNLRKFIYLIIALINTTNIIYFVFLLYRLWNIIKSLNIFTSFILSNNNSLFLNHLNDIDKKMEEDTKESLKKLCKMNDEQIGKALANIITNPLLTINEKIIMLKMTMNEFIQFYDNEGCIEMNNKCARLMFIITFIKKKIMKLEYKLKNNNENNNENNNKADEISNND